MEKAYAKDAAAVADFARENFPCTDLLKNDTTFIIQDSTIYIDCPETKAADYFTVYNTDTVWQKITKTVKVPVNLPVKTFTITRYWEDSAKIKRLTTDSNSCNADLNTTKQKLSKRTTYLWALLALCIGLTAWNFRKLIAKL